MDIFGSRLQYAAYIILGLAFIIFLFALVNIIKEERNSHYVKSISGLVVSKELEYNRSTKIGVLQNMNLDTTYILIDNYKGLYNYIAHGDSLFKLKNELAIKVKRNGKEKIYTYK